MKPSRYNFIVPYQFNRDYSVVYNAFKNTVGILTAREAEFIRTCDRCLGIHDTKIDDFIEKGFVVDANVNELSILKLNTVALNDEDGELLLQLIQPTALA